MSKPVEDRGIPGPQMRGVCGTQYLWPIPREVGWASVALSLLILAGCGHKQTLAPLPEEETAPSMADAQPQSQEQFYPASPPPLPQGEEQSPEQETPSARIAPTPAPAGGVSAEDLRYIRTHRPIQSEEGLATWYTAARGRRSANGDLFSDRALTAAHRTLPMGSLVVVTNLTTNESSPMRITDRGPFVEGRIVDLTIASAKATGIYRSGTAQVRVDVYRTPKPISSGGRWCVQIGAFTSEKKANKLKSQLKRKYPGATVIDFPGEDSYWVRIRPEGDNRRQAERIARLLRPKEGQAFLTRLD
jgi:rare lipoprotein A